VSKSEAQNRRGTPNAVHAPLNARRRTSMLNALNFARVVGWRAWVPSPHVSISSIRLVAGQGTHGSMCSGVGRDWKPGSRAPARFASRASGGDNSRSMPELGCPRGIAKTEAASAPGVRPGGRFRCAARTVSMPSVVSQLPLTAVPGTSHAPVPPATARLTHYGRGEYEHQGERAVGNATGTLNSARTAVAPAEHAPRGAPAILARIPYISA
jgi:hypothetical protein